MFASVFMCVFVVWRGTTVDLVLEGDRNRLDFSVRVEIIMVLCGGSNMTWFLCWVRNWPGFGAEGRNWLIFCVRAENDCLFFTLVCFMFVLCTCVTQTPQTAHEQCRAIKQHEARAVVLSALYCCGVLL